MGDEEDEVHLLMDDEEVHLLMMFLLLG